MAQTQAQRDRVVLRVGPHENGWAFEQEGEWLCQSANREEARAAATKQARMLMDSGRACQVVMHGELGYFTSPAKTIDR